VESFFAGVGGGVEDGVVIVVFLTWRSGIVRPGAGGAIAGRRGQPGQRRSTVPRSPQSSKTAGSGPAVAGQRRAVLSADYSAAKVRTSASHWLGCTAN
jgi:hypothetical protein